MSINAYKTHNWGVKWTEEEDIRLLQGIERFGDNDWRRVSEVVGTRDAVKCQQRWDKVLRPDLLKGKWTEDEDDRLKCVVMDGYDHWGKVAERMPGRTAKQCRERWTNYLDPTLLKTPFTGAEDEKILLLQRLNGNKWALISRELPGRTENGVKLRFNYLKKTYGENLLLPLPNVTPAEAHHSVYHNQQTYDVHKDARRKSSEVLDHELGGAKKQRTTASNNNVIAHQPMNYNYMDHSNVMNTLHNNNAQNMQLNMQHSSSLHNPLYMHSAPAMQPFPSYAMNIMGNADHYDVHSSSSHSNHAEAHNIFYSQMPHNSMAYLDSVHSSIGALANSHELHSSAHGQDGPFDPSVPSGLQDIGDKKYAALQEFVENNEHL